MNSVSETLRRHGVHFADHELRVWLDDLTPRRRRKRAVATPQKTSTNAANAPQTSRNHAAAYARAAKVSLADIAGSSLLTSFVEPHLPDPAVQAEPPTKNKDGDTPAISARVPRAQRLPLDAEVQTARRAILAAIWDLLAATPYAATITKTTWFARNANVAGDLVSLKIAPDRCIQAWHSATRRLGAPVRTLRIVQDELGRIASPTPRANNTTAGIREFREDDRK